MQIYANHDPGEAKIAGPISIPHRNIVLCKRHAWGLLSGRKWKMSGCPFPPGLCCPGSRPDPRCRGRLQGTGADSEWRPLAAQHPRPRVGSPGCQDPWPQGQPCPALASALRRSHLPPLFPIQTAPSLLSAQTHLPLGFPRISFSSQPPSSSPSFSVAFSLPNLLVPLPREFSGLLLLEFVSLWVSICGTPLSVAVTLWPLVLICL